MRQFYIRLLTGLLCSVGWLLLAPSALAQGGVVSGKVTDAESGEGLIGVSISVVGKVTGTLTDAEGNFRLNLAAPGQLRFSYVGYASQTVDAAPGQTLNIQLSASDVQANEVVVSASRVAETVLQAPVTVERVDAVTIAQQGAVNYYQGLQNLKGVDVATSSIGFQIVNARGFNSTGNTRMIQMIDGMDVQAPVLNFPVGNLNGPSELDVQSVEFLPGASSALYGPQAFNGALMINSRNPFTFQGLSAYVKVGTHQVNDGGPQLPIYDASIRYAKAFNDRFAFKVNISYFTAEDWHGQTYDLTRTNRTFDLYGGSVPGQAPLNPRGFAQNPAYNGVHTLGDETSLNLRQLLGSTAFTGSIVANLNATLQGANPAGGATQWTDYANAIFGGAPGADLLLVNALLPNQFVTRTGYWEGYFVDYRTENFKPSLALHWRAGDNLELIAQYNGGYGTSVYTGAQRYSINDFWIHQAKLEARGSNYFVRAYYTLENSGNSYIADAIAAGVNETVLPTGNWAGVYSTAYLANLAGALAGNGVFTLDGVNAFLGNTSVLNTIHNNARASADGFASGARLDPNSEQFRGLVSQIRGRNLSESVPGARGSKFDDQSAFAHVEGQYDFKNQIDWIELQVGGNFRRFLLNTNGTILDDLNSDIEFDEYGAYLQVGKRFFDERLRLLASLRYDKNENFEGQFNPRIAAQYEIAENHSIRASYGTGFRFPTTQGQYINLDVTTNRLLGGLPQILNRYQLGTQTYTEASVEAAQAVYAQQLAATGNNAASLLAARASLVAYDAVPVKPEQVRAFEVGYKGLIDNKLFIDAAYYYNDYSDFITQVLVRRSPLDPFSADPTTAVTGTGALLLSPRLSNSTAEGPHAVPTQASVFFPYANSDKRVYAQGAVLGLEYSLPNNFYVSGNYNWNKLITELDPLESAIYSFNTPEHKANLSFGSKKILENGAFQVSWRWQDTFLWESSFAIGEVPAFNTVDAQISYRLPDIKTTVKIGGQNILNHRYIQNFGGPELGAIYYIQLTFDSMMSR